MRKLWLGYLLSVSIVAIPVGIITLFQLFLGKISFFSDDIQKWTSFHVMGLMLFQAIIFLTMIVLVYRIFRPDFFHWNGSVSFKEIVLGISGLILINIIAKLIMDLMHVEATQFEELNKVLLKKNSVVFILTVAGFAPIYEEIVFRGFILRILWPSKNNIYLKAGAVLFTSFLFSLIHFDLDAAIPIFLLSLYLSIWTIIKKNIFLSIVIHSTQNFIASVAFLYLNIG